MSSENKVSRSKPQGLKTLCPGKSQKTSYQNVKITKTSDLYKRHGYKLSRYHIQRNSYLAKRARIHAKFHKILSRYAKSLQPKLSSASSRGQDCAFQSILARKGQGQILSKHSQGRLQIPVVGQASTTVLQSKRNKEIRSGFGFTTRGSGDVEKAGNRESHARLARIQCNFLSSAQERWGNETSDQSETSEQVHSHTHFQNAHPPINSQNDSGGQLVGVNRFEGRVFPCANPSGVQEIPQVCLPRSGISIQGASLRVVDSTQSIYENASTNRSIIASEEHTIIPVLGRHIDSGSITSQDEICYRQYIASSTASWVHN